MTQKQRIKNDKATTERRDIADKTLESNRDRNDEATAERRAKSDKTLESNRDRNDEATAERREIKDFHNSKGTFTIFLLILVILALGSYLIFF